MIRNRCVVWTTAFAVAVGASAVFAAPLIDVGAGTATGISTDGSVVAIDSSGQAAIWSQSNGLKLLGGTKSAGVAIKGTTVVVGGVNGGAASRWNGTADGVGSWTALPLADGTTAWTPLCTSASGTNVWIGGNSGASTGTRKAVRYKESSASTTTLGLPGNYNMDAYVYGVSEIGNYAGRAQYGGVSGNGARGAVGGSTLTGLNPIIGAQTTSNEAVANAISRTGNRAGGWSTYSGGQRQGTIWNINPVNSTPVVAIPFIGTDNYDEVQALNNDGTIAAGYGRDLVAGTRRLWIWDAVNGSRDLATVLTAAGWNLTGWTLTDVKGMSGDGSIITGTGTFGGVTHTWVTPEPATMLVFALGGLAVLRRRR